MFSTVDCPYRSDRQVTPEFIPEFVGQITNEVEDQQLCPEVELAGLRRLQCCQTFLGHTSGGGGHTAIACSIIRSG